MRILITGAGGYVSSGVLTQLLNELNVEESEVDYIMATDREGVPPNDDVVADPNAEWISADLDKVGSVWWDEVITTNQIDLIYYMESVENINLCDTSNIVNNMLQISDFYFINFLENRVIIETTPDIKVVYISTDKIYYGDDFPNETHDIVLKSGDSSLERSQVYFYSYVALKALAEVRLKSIPKIDLRIIRPFGITGPGRNESCPISVNINLALTNSEIQMYGDGSQGVAFTHINDLVTLLVHPNLFNPDIKANLNTNVINFCRVQNYLSVLQLNNKIINKTESNSNLTKDNEYNIFNKVQDTPQIRNMVRIYQPQIPIDLVLEDMIYELDPINSYVDLVVDSVTLDETTGSINIIGAAEPLSGITFWFGNGEVYNNEVKVDGTFDITYTFEYAIDVYPIEIRVTTKDLIQYATEIIITEEIPVEDI